MSGIHSTFEYWVGIVNVFKMRDISFVQLVQKYASMYKYHSHSAEIQLFIIKVIYSKLVYIPIGYSCCSYKIHSSLYICHREKHNLYFWFGENMSTK